MDKIKQIQETIELIKQLDLIQDQFKFYEEEGDRLTEEHKAIVKNREHLFPKGAEKLKTIDRKLGELTIRFEKDNSLFNNILVRVNNLIKKHNNV
jgi:propanediol utilization protein